MFLFFRKFWCVLFRNICFMDDETQINKVKEHPCLYNTKLSDYKVLLKKENAWKAISTAVKASGEVI